MKYFLIAFNGLKKKKGDAIALFFLIIFATVMMYVGISIFSNLEKVVDGVNERNNGADIFVVTQTEPAEEIKNLLAEYEGVKTLESGKSAYCASISYWKEDVDEKEEMAFIIEPLEQKGTISVMEIVDCGEEKKANSIVLPYYLHVAKGYETGDIIHLEIGNQTYPCEVYGFIEDILFATPTNVSLYHVLMEEETLEKIEKEQLTAVFPMQSYKIKLEAGYDREEMEGKLYTAIENTANNFNQVYTMLVNYDTMRFADLISANILMAILIVFALMILLVTIVIICFSIQNSLERNMTNIGILEASGYTAGQLRCSTMLEIFIVTAVGIAAALAASPALTEMVGDIVASTIGVRWTQGFDGVSAVITAVIILFFVMLAAYLVAGKYKKISILDALRGGVKTHNFCKNHVPLEKTHLPAHIALGVKGIFNQKRKSIAICIITSVMAVAANTGFFLYQNFVLSNDSLVDLVGIERAAAQILIADEAEINEVGETLSELDEILRVKYMASGSLKISNGEVAENVYQTEFWTETENFTTKILVEGRYPKYDNEILLSRVVCENLGVAVGDTVTVSNEEKSSEYLVVGISEHISYLGQKAVMTMDGIQKINKEVHQNTLVIYKNEDVTYEELKEAIHEVYPEYEIIDVENVILSACASVSMGMSALCIVFNVCTILIVTIIMFLMIRMKLTQEKVRMGVDKALGFTTIQLITRVVMNYLPVVFAGAVLGGVVSYVSFNPLVSLCLGFCGIRNCQMMRGIEFIGATIAIITLTALIASICVSARIRKIEPSKMIRE